MGYSQGLMKKTHPLFLFVLFAFLPFWVHAQSITAVEGFEDEASKRAFNWLPYGFFSESFGLGLGVGAGYTAWPHPESSILGAATVGTSGSYNLVLGGSQLRFPGIKRLYVEPLVMTARYQDQFLYVGSKNEGFEGKRAGANDSDADNYLEATQWDNRVEIEFKFLLPIGHGRGDDIINTYTVQNGVLTEGATGAESWNPLESGRTSINITPAWREQTLENDDFEVPLQTRNVTVGIERDNRDFPFNASRGSYQSLSYQKDFRNSDALGGWEAWFGELDWAFDVGPGPNAIQRVLAFNFWAAYVPTWETDAEGNPTKRPPQFEGANLGGLYRMRGYEPERFHDKSAVVYTAEYRVIPDWQPIKEMAFLEWAQIRYWQWAVFAEAGQVSPSWSVSDLHDDLHVDAGVSLRGMFYKAVLRLDVAVSEEGSRVVAMYGHPF